MAPTLKRNILKLGIFMLAAACIPSLMFLLVLAPNIDWLGGILPALAAFSYAGVCLCILAWSSIEVILILPFNGILRAAVFVVWAILYPLLCAGWFLLCFLYLINVLDVHC